MVIRFRKGVHGGEGGKGLDRKGYEVRGEILKKRGQRTERLITEREREKKKKKRAINHLKC